MKENTIEKIQELENNQEFVAKAAEANSAEEMLAVLAEYNIHLTEEELKEVLVNDVVTTENGELSETMLDNISGGGRVWDWVKARFKSWFDKKCEKNAQEIGDIISNINR